MREWAKFTGYLLSIALAVAVLAVIAAPARAQVFTATGMPAGVVRFEAPAEWMVLAPGQVSRRVAVLPPGAVVTVLTEWQPVVTFWTLDGSRSEILGEPQLDIGDTVAVCAFIEAGGQRVAVDPDCGCVAPGLARLWPGALTYSSDDPAVASVAPASTLCDQPG